MKRHANMVHASISLKPALDAIGKAIDQRFDRLLPVPDDSRARLYNAMRHAVIGGRSLYVHARWRLSCQ